MTAELEVPKSNRQDRQLEKNKTKFSNLLGSQAVTTATIDAPRGGWFLKMNMGNFVFDVTMWDLGHDWWLRNHYTRPWVRIKSSNQDLNVHAVS